MLEGIFHSLDEECKIPTPKTASFIQKVISKHMNCNTFSSRQPTKTSSHFVIQHFGHRVQYNSVSDAAVIVFRLIQQVSLHCED